MSTANAAKFIAFEVPQLPGGVYDAWYTGGKPVSRSASLPPPIEPPVADASQFITFEISPQLRAARSVVRAEPGKDVEVVVGVRGPVGEQTSVTLSGFNSVARLAPGQKQTVKTDSDGSARFKIRVASEGDIYLAAKSPGYSATVVRVVGGPQHKLRDHRLRPADLLLCQGNGFFSKFISFGEQVELGSKNPRDRGWYSHVAIYLDKGETAEMLDDGLVRHGLEDTLNDCTTVDVYRREGITPVLRQRVVDIIRGYESPLPYAWKQIAVLAAAGAIGLEAKITDNAGKWFLCGFTFGHTCAMEARLHAKLEAAFLGAMLFYPDDQGRQSMICSELAAWAYRDANMALDVDPWWPDIEKRGILKRVDAPVDFTTPNMIARSKDANFVFQLWPPVEGARLREGQVQLSEQIVFDRGSAVIGKDEEDLLTDVAQAISELPESRRVRVEGHTDDTGFPADNHRLSHQRAEAVMMWLKAHGVKASRLSSEGFGDTRPLVPNDTPQNRHRNRRVEFHVDGSQPAK